MDRGTEFDALIDGEKISITLISGGLSVASPGHDIAVLKPGQKIETGVGKPIRVTAVDIEAALAWRTGYLEFSDVALEGAISEINRYGAPAVRIADPSVRAIKVSGRFRAGNPGRFARALAEMYPLRVIERSDGGIDIAAR
jgi:transmembrane sensor